MQKEIDSFILYLHNVKKTSTNTELSYKRDLGKVAVYMAGNGIEDVHAITPEKLSGYIQYMEDNHFAAASVSRSVASIKALYHYLLEEGVVDSDVSEVLKAPKIEKKFPEILSTEEVLHLLEQPDGDSVKEIRTRQCWNFYMQPESV